MLQPHQRAAQIPNEPGVSWLAFLGGRFVEASGDFAVVVQRMAQSPTHSDLEGLIELSSGGSLPVVYAFTGVLKLEFREISLQQTHPEKRWDGQLSENGRVMTLHEAGRTKAIHLVHEMTLEQFL
ncbi:MAG: hypothetical protein ABJF10_04105 [Chthoniobacter sp.]|uniref:hypothetical protein n=1 Tax=Chthoniobacter sp. TaxID=2510640 RepID=UPI0032ABC5C4